MFIQTSNFFKSNNYPALFFINWSLQNQQDKCEKFDHNSVFTLKVFLLSDIEHSVCLTGVLRNILMTDTIKYLQFADFC